MQTVSGSIRPLAGKEEARSCANLMSSSEPWVTLGRGEEASLRIIEDPSREVYVAVSGDRIAGFLILCLTGAFVGYIQTVAVAAEFRGQGLGSRLIAFAEERIFSQWPNVFMCVSDFNSDAKRLYLRLGYEIIGELRDYIVAGHSEILLRKSRGAIVGFEPGKD
jgi:ribosomal protein S18 acetylase RimI-like enzyme